MRLVSAYSVFSHLSEASARAWVSEFARILAPVGYVAFTTRAPSFNVEGYTRALGALFTDIDKARHRYNVGDFVHVTSVGVSVGAPRNETFYGESFIPPSQAMWRIISVSTSRVPQFPSIPRVMISVSSYSANARQDKVTPRACARGASWV